jgi:hypothetical protein
MKPKQIPFHLFPFLAEITPFTILGKPSKLMGKKTKGVGMVVQQW